MADPFAESVVLDIRCLSPDGSDVVPDYAERHSVTLNNGVLIGEDPEALTTDLGIVMESLVIDGVADVELGGSLADFDILPYTNDMTVELEFATPDGFSALDPDYLRQLPLFKVGARVFVENYADYDWYTEWELTISAGYTLISGIWQASIVITAFGIVYDSGTHDYDYGTGFYFKLAAPRPVADGEIMQVAVSKVRDGMTTDVIYRVRVNDTWYTPEEKDGPVYAGTDFPAPTYAELGTNYAIPG